jgi:hypothetical protein
MRRPPKAVKCIGMQLKTLFTFTAYVIAIATMSVGSAGAGLTTTYTHTTDANGNRVTDVHTSGFLVDAVGTANAYIPASGWYDHHSYSIDVKEAATPTPTPEFVPTPTPAPTPRPTPTPVVPVIVEQQNYEEMRAASLAGKARVEAQLKYDLAHPVKKSH